MYTLMSIVLILVCHVLYAMYYNILKLGAVECLKLTDDFRETHS